MRKIANVIHYYSPIFDNRYSDTTSFLSSKYIQQIQNKSDPIKPVRSHRKVHEKRAPAYYFEIDRIAYKNPCDSSLERVGCWSVNLTEVACPSRAQTFVTDMRRVENRVTNLPSSGFYSSLTNT